MVCVCFFVSSFQTTIIYYLFITLHDNFLIFWYKTRVFVLPCCFPTAGLLAGKLRHGNWHLPALSLQMLSSNLSTAAPCQNLFSLLQATGGKGEFVRLSASTLRDGDSRIGEIREWEWWGLGASRAAGGKEVQRRELMRHEDFYSFCGNMEISEKNPYFEWKCWKL